MARNSSTETENIMAEISSTENENIRMGSSLRNLCRICFPQFRSRNSRVIFCVIHGVWLQVRIIQRDGEKDDQVYYRIPETYMIEEAEAWFKQHGPPLMKAEVGRLEVGMLY
ncbi:hypothetical protein K435DRAFT_810703 [Dendrothele bispora CBS 962.96]|uniref:Uncharacterized protein n=1 Tax=Dendrothele bispora (strain CBS 962.96) TaxID=1314807 RepID=A0A4S8KU99_DENBC|nr:hypothetical protein K435DRAFT_810703 [Dendrothele bispora CBS 962.96]